MSREAKAKGLTFEDFWGRAMRLGCPPITGRKFSQTPGAFPTDAVVWPSDTADRATEQAAAEAMKEAWRRAYEQVPPTRGEEAMLVLYGIAYDPAASGIRTGSEIPLAA